MKIIGLDFSNNHPGVCISDAFETFDFISLTDATKITHVNRKFIEDASAEMDNYFCDFYESNPTRASKYYYENERMKIYNALRLKKLISLTIVKHAGTTDDCIVSMEGMAYGAKGSSLIDIAQATGVVRDMLFGDIVGGHAERLFFFTPGELKNAIGVKGNAGKKDVFDAFIEDPVIEAVRDTDFHGFMSEQSEHRYIVSDRGVVQHPWEDVIDAYLCVLKVYLSLK